MDVKGKKIMVVGTGISGIGAAELLADNGALVVLYDGNDKLDKKDVEAKVSRDNIEILIGEYPKEYESCMDMLVISPGVSIYSPMVESFKKNGVKVWGEIQLAYSYDAGALVAITGTNGKTTTTALTGEIMKAFNDKTYVVGNIGTPYTKEVHKTSEDSVTVAEISSFQLETIEDFRPNVSAILNITPDHLDRHKTFECYAKTKEDITRNQTEQDVCVLNYEDELLREFGLNECKASVVWFSSACKPPVGAFVDGEDICYYDGESTERLMNVHDMNLIGVHNYENVCAAIAITKAMGVPMNIILDTVKRFKAVEHRIEFVRAYNDVYYYNDSKGTNPDAAIKAINAMSRPTILIGGGYDKGADFAEYVGAFDPMIKELVLIGKTADKIEAAARAIGFNNIVRASSMEEAVKVCARDAVPGDAVLLSPACASWDMFKSYEQRGKMFKDYVNDIK